MKKLTMLAACVAVATMASSVAYAAPAVDFGGTYFRASVGSSRDGGQFTQNKNFLGRLGNESDVWSDIGLGANVFESDDLSIRGETMFALYNNGIGRGEKTDTDLEQLNIQIKGLIPNDPDAVVWGGKRHYQREDIHQLDVKYYNVSGLGGGLEYLQVGPGKLSLAWTRNDAEGFQYRYNDQNWNEWGWVDENNRGYKLYDKSKSINVNYLDARYAGWAPCDGAWTEFGFTYVMPKKGEGDDRNGQVSFYEGYNGQFNLGDAYMATAQFSQSFNGGWNKTIVQYTTGGLAHHAIDIGDLWMDFWHNSDNAKGLNIINTGVTTICENLSMLHVVAYGVENHVSEDYTVTSFYGQKGDVSSKLTNASENGYTPIDRKDSFRVVVRPSYQLTKYTRLLAEIGAYWNHTKYAGQDKVLERQQKYTLAYAIAPTADIFSRPEVRFFVTYLHASDWDKTDANWTKGIRNADGDKYYKDNYIFGIQAEAWW